MAAAETEALAGVEKLVATTSWRQTGTHHNPLSGDGIGGSNCNGTVDGNVDGYIEDIGGSEKRK